MDCDPLSTITNSTIPTSQLQELCRLCANTDNQLMNIFNGEGLEHDIAKKIEKHIPIIKVSLYYNLIILIDSLQILT